jgi:hypothetical protein
MKKFIAVLLVLVAFSTAAFAAPAVPGTAIEKGFSTTAECVTAECTTVTRNVAFGGFSEDLFASVNAVALTETQAAEVEGEAIPIIVWAIVAVAVALTATSCDPLVGSNSCQLKGCGCYN